MTRHVLNTMFAVLLAMPQVAMACVFIAMQPWVNQ